MNGETDPSEGTPAAPKISVKIAGFIGGCGLVGAALVAFNGQLPAFQNLACEWHIWWLCPMPPMPSRDYIFQCNEDVAEGASLKATLDSLGLVNMGTFHGSYVPGDGTVTAAKPTILSSLDTPERRLAGEWLAHRLSASEHSWAYVVGRSISLMRAETDYAFVVYPVGPGCRAQPTRDARWKERFFPLPKVADQAVSIDFPGSHVGSVGKAREVMAEFTLHMPSIHFEVARLNGVDSSNAWTVLFGNGLTPELAARALSLFQEHYHNTPPDQIPGSVVTGVQ